MTTQARHGALRARTRFFLCASLGTALLCACNNTNNNATLGNKGLWIANGPNVIEYIPSQFKTGAQNMAPHLAINSPAFGSPQGVTFDASGNLWVMDPGANVDGKPMTPALLEFSAAQLAALPTNNTPAPTAIITSTALNFPQEAVFDGTGNLWVTDHNNNTVLVFSMSQLAMTGTNALTPMLTITSTAFNGPLGVAFDSAKDLWVANNGGVAANGATSPAGTTIVEFTSAMLPALTATAATNALTPAVTLTDDGQNSIQAPWALAFDSMGDLWSSNANAPNTLVKFAASSLMMSGTPTPTVTISSAMVSGTPSLDAPNGLCFDQNGNIAATDSADAFGVPFYGAKQLATGSPTPDTFFVGSATTLNAPAGCEFATLVN